MKIRHLIVFAICALVFVAVAAFAFVTIRDEQERTRGIEWHDLPGRAAIGVNAALEQYSNADLNRALALVRDQHVTLVRQHFYWNEIEPRPGEFQWARWDRIVDSVSASGLDLIAVIDTTPEWARDPGERDLVNAPPARVEDYAHFAQAFAQHYGDRVRYIQIWDNPNVHPFWGRRNADPFEYTALLRAGASAARSANPSVKILSAGLAPNKELIRGHPDYADVLYLREMYDAGARDYFDILGAKPYGMWTGPEDRRASLDVLNFSRAILLRDEMLAHGDAAKPVWAVEFGWNALPTNWEGKPSPWGTDTVEVQGARLAAAVQRAHGEWSWMGALVAQTFQPNAPGDDPVWGFALADKNLAPRSLFNSLSSAATASVQPAAFNFTRFYGMLAALAFIGLLAASVGATAAWQLPWARPLQAVEMRFTALPELVQFALIAVAVIAFYVSRNTLLNLTLLALVVLLFAARLDLGLAIAVFTVPFYLFPKNLVGSAQFSLVEILTLAAVAGWGLEQVKRQKLKVESNNGSVILSQASDESSPKVAQRPQNLATRILGSWSPKSLLRVTIGTFASCLSTFDLAILLFVLAGAISIFVASNFGVANREFRVIVLEPALLYGLIRASHLSRASVWRLVDAFILSAVAISLIGLYQFFFTNWVIVGEGVRRILAVYGSPNNLALYLDRALPLLIVLALFLKGKRERLLYALAAIPVAVCWLLTYSRAAWLGVAVALVFVGLFSGKRTRLAVIALLVVGAIAIIPFLGTPRAQSLFEEGTGTGFFRVSVWQSGLAMIRDHPLFGVGLDNFLYEYPKYMQPGAWREPNLSHPHNIVLDFWVRMGILGVVALGWMVFEFYRRGMRGMKGNGGILALGLMAGMTAALAHGMMDAAYFYVDLAFVWMLFLALVNQEQWAAGN